MCVYTYVHLRMYENGVYELKRKCDGAKFQEMCNKYYNFMMFLCVCMYDVHQMILTHIHRILSIHVTRTCDLFKIIQD